MSKFKVGGIYTNLDDKDIVKVTSIMADVIVFEVLKDDLMLWSGGLFGHWADAKALSSYVSLGELAEAIYE